MAGVVVVVCSMPACGAPPDARPRSPTALVAAADQPASAPGPTATASSAASPAPSTVGKEPTRAPLAVPRAALLTSADPEVRARVLTAGTSSTMPTGKSPSLVRGLAFGMNAKEASKAIGTGRAMGQAVRRG